MLVPSCTKFCKGATCLLAYSFDTKFDDLMWCDLGLWSFAGTGICRDIIPFLLQSVLTKSNWNLTSSQPFLVLPYLTLTAPGWKSMFTPFIWTFLAWNSAAFLIHSQITWAPNLKTLKSHFKGFFFEDAGLERSNNEQNYNDLHGKQTLEFHLVNSF